MLGIWEYFWDVLDWVAAPSAAPNICQVVATVSEAHVATAPMSQLNINTVKV